MTSFQNKNIIPKLVNIARNSDISFKLAATLIQGNKPIGHMLPNTNRICCRGKISPSMHAEANTLLRYYGKALHYSDSSGWRVLRGTAKVAKVRYNCYSC